MFDNLDGRRSYKPFTFYGQSNLATALFAKELSRRLAGWGIAVNSLHPGATRGTNLNANLGLRFRLILSIAQRFMKSVAQGAATQVLLAASPLVEGITGEYWSDCQVAEGNAFGRSPYCAAPLDRIGADRRPVHRRGSLRPKRAPRCARERAPHSGSSPATRTDYFFLAARAANSSCPKAVPSGGG